MMELQDLKGKVIEKTEVRPYLSEGETLFITFTDGRVLRVGVVNIHPSNSGCPQWAWKIELSITKGT